MKRPLSWLVGGILALTLVLAAVYAFRQQLIAPYIEKRVVAELESRFGVRVAIGHIGGTFVTTLELRNVKTVGTTHKGPVTRIVLEKGQVRYFLPDLFGGVDNLLRGMNIVLEGARIDVDLDRLPTGKKAESKQPGGLPSPFDLPDLHVRDSRLDVHGRGLQLDLAGLDADLQPPETEGAAPARLGLQATATIAHPWIKKQAGPLAALLTYDQAHLVLDRLRFAGKPLVRRASLDLRHRREGVLALRAALRPFGGKADLRIRLAGTAVEGQARLGGVHLHALSSLLAISGLPSFAGTLDGTAQVRADIHHVAETLDGHLDLRVEGGRLRQVAADSLRLEATARKGEILIRHFAGRIGSNRLAVDGLGIPAPALVKRQWSRLLAASPGTFSLQLDDIPALLAMAGRRAEWPKRIPAHHLELQGKIGNRSLAVSRGLLRIGRGVVRVRTARFGLPPPGAAWSETAVEAGLTVDLPQLAEVGAVFGIPGLQGALSGDIDVRGTLGAPQGRAAVAGKDLAFRNTALGNLHLVATADRQRVQVKTFTLVRASDFVRGHTTLRLHSRRIEDLALDFSLAAIERYANLLPHHLQAAGRLAGTLTAEGPLAGPTAALRATLSKGTIAGLAVPSAKVALENRGRTIGIEEAELTTARGSVALAGTVDRGPENRQLSARLRSLRLTTPAGGELRLAGPATLSYSPRAGVFAAHHLTLRGNMGEIRLDGRLSRQTPSALKVRLAGLTSRYWLPRPTREQYSFSGLDAELTFTGSLKEPAFQTAGRLAAIRLPNVPFPVRGAFDLAFGAQGLRISRLGLTGASGLEISLAGSLPLNPWRKEMFLPGDLSLTGRIDMPSLELLPALAGRKVKLEGALGGDLRLTGTWADPRGHLQLRGWGLRFEHSSFPAPPRPLDLTADVEIQGKELRLRTLRLTSPDIDFTASGRWTQGPSLRNILRSRHLRPTGNLDFRGKLDLPSITWLARGFKPIRRVAGALKADLTVSGPAREPLVNGTLLVSNGELRTTWALPPIDGLAVTAKLAGRRLLLQQVRGEMGSAPFSLTGSIARSKGTTVYDLTLRGSNLLLFRNDWMMVRTDSDLDITGPFDHLAVRGKLAITNGYYRRNVDFLSMLRGTGRPKVAGGLQLFSIRKGPLRAMTFDVKISAKNPFRIENNVAKASVRPDLTLTGTGELPVLMGNIYVNESTISLPTTRLQVHSGLIRFLKDRPNRPSIDLLAEAKMAGYDISVQIEGTYSQPEVTLSSVPPLPHDDLLLLLLTGRQPTNGGVRETAQAGGINIAVYLGKGLLARWFHGSDSNQESLLDRLQVQIGQGGTSQTGQETLNAQLELAKGVVKKGDVLYLTADRDIYDDYNIGLKIVFRFK